jgi:predicted TIM-barrel fold metal-dependent hydrolase
VQVCAQQIAVVSTEQGRAVMEAGMDWPYDFDLISTDSHLEVSPDMWRPFVEEEFREFVPKVVKLPDGGDGWLMPGNDKVVPLGLNFSAGRGFENLKVSGLSYADGLVGAGDGAQRLGEMDEDGVYAEILFPAISGQRTLDSGGMPSDAYVAIARGYNDWLSREYTAVDPARLLGLALLPATNVSDAMAELRRISTMPGIRGVVLHSWPNGSGLPQPEVDEAFWRLAVDLGVPLTVHNRFGGGAAAETAQRIKDAAGSKMSLTNSAPMNHLLSKTVTPGYVSNQLITTGVFDRIPQLQFFFAETQVGWIPEYMEDADENYHRHKYWSQLDLKHDPSWYVANHFSWGFQVDRFGLKVRSDIGLDRIQWSTDFPHVQCDWPNSRKVIIDQFAGIADDEARLILRDNAVRYFRLDEE